MVIFPKHITLDSFVKKYACFVGLFQHGKITKNQLLLTQASFPMTPLTVNKLYDTNS
jgi:hypothetical protein